MQKSNLIFSLRKTLDWIKKPAPQRVDLAHMHIPLDYNIVNERTPENIEPVYGGITFEYDAEEICLYFISSTCMTRHASDERQTIKGRISSALL